MFKKEHISFLVHGLNFNKFLLSIRKNNISFFNLNKREDNNYSFEVLNENKKFILTLLKNCNLKVLKQTPISKPLKFFENIKSRLIYAIVSFVFLISIFVCNFFVFKIEIYGLERVSKQSVLKVLNESNINAGKLKSSYELSKIDDVLKGSIYEISLASATIVGNTLIINIREKVNSNQTEKNPILAPYDMIIKNVELKSGTNLVKTNQTVKKGQEIISNYINYKDGSSLQVEPQAKISAYAEKTISTIYFENHLEKVRSGKSEVFNDVIFFKKTKNINCNFEEFETESEENYIFKNFIFPIKLIRVRCYEVVSKQVFKPFSEEIKQKLIEENEKLLYNTFDNCLSVEDRKLTSNVKFVENYYIVSTTISANIVF